MFCIFCINCLFMTYSTSNCNVVNVSMECMHACMYVRTPNPTVRAVGIIYFIGTHHSHLPCSSGWNCMYITCVIHNFNKNFALFSARL